MKTTWKCTFCLDGILYHAFRRKAERLGIPMTRVATMAIAEYLERHPKENEAEEKSLYCKDNDD